MIINGDSDYRHALEVLMDRGKYNDLDMLRAAHMLINNIAYPKSGEKDQSILPTSNRAELMEIAQMLESFVSWVRLGEIHATINITSDL
jgi:hypothetical protein